MAANKHNKRRNSLLIYEFLVRTISKSIIDDDKKKSAAALKILKKHFRPGTELYKEFRLMNALVKTTVSSEHTAASILSEAKNAAGSFDAQKLDREKSILIRNINHILNDDNFYDQHVNEYRTFATIQTLLNEWRSSSKDLYKVAQYEDQVMKHLVTEKTQTEDSTISEDTSGTARLLMKVMSKKLNEKYNGILNEQQKSLIKAYAYSTASEDQSSIKLKLQEIKTGLIELLDSYQVTVQNDYLKNKLSETRQTLLEESLDEVNDSTVTRFMLYAKLNDELVTKE
jgi:hypothetical protein